MSMKCALAAVLATGPDTFDQRLADERGEKAP